MTNNLTTNPARSLSLSTRMLIGGTIALAVIALLVLPINHPKPEWGQFWMIRPFIITPLAGMVGGAVSYYLTQKIPQVGWLKFATIVLSVVIYLIGLWMGIVLGLAGTLWN